MSILRKFAENHAHPKGWMGKLVGWRLSIVNRVPNDWTIGLLNLKPTDHVLEIGFGPGLGIQKTAAVVSAGFVAGVETSDVMLQAAQARNVAAIAERRVELKYGDASALPYADRTFDKVFAVNVAYFWQEPLACLREVHRVTKPDARIALFIEDKDKLAKSGKLIQGIYRLYMPEELAQLLCQAGFSRTWFETRVFKYGKSFCVLGER